MPIVIMFTNTKQNKQSLFETYVQYVYRKNQLKCATCLYLYKRQNIKYRLVKINFFIKGGKMLKNNWICQAKNYYPPSKKLLPKNKASRMIGYKQGWRKR